MIVCLNMLLAASILFASTLTFGNCFLHVNLKDNIKAQGQMTFGIPHNITVELKTKTRTRRSTHYEEFDLNFNVNGTNVRLHLKQNDHIVTDVPTLRLRDGTLKTAKLKDTTIHQSTFYQDTTSGAVFMVQKYIERHTQVMGMIRLGDSEYMLQSNEDYDPAIVVRNANITFKIYKEKLDNELFGDFEVTETNRIPINAKDNRRTKRATNEYIVELLIVVDYSIFEYWYDKSTSNSTLDKEMEAVESIRQFYAFGINGVDAVYKNIQTTDYTIIVVFAGVVIAETPSEAPWTENIKVTSASPFQVDSSNALISFSSWIQSESAFLPDHDHAMLFTKYDLTADGSTSNAGKAYISAACSDSGQSVVEDHFSFKVITIAAHELGHSLGSKHDGTGNSCSSSNSYIMAPSISFPDESTIATNPWKFSSCSTVYFTSYISSLDSAFMMEISVVSVPYFGVKFLGQIHAGKLELLKWCQMGFCTYDSNAPSGIENCLYGDILGAVYTNGWTCEDMVKNAPSNCPSKQIDCCDSCAPYITTTTTTPGTLNYDIDQECEGLYGAGSYMCRNTYNGNFSSICSTLWCSDVIDPGKCYSRSAYTSPNFTPCGDKEWCVNGLCVSNTNAPSADESCLFGDRRGTIFTNGWTCTDMVRIAPNNCEIVPIECCYSCAPYLTTTASPTTIFYNTTTGTYSTLSEDLSSTSLPTPTSALPSQTSYASSTLPSSMMSSITSELSTPTSVSMTSETTSSITTQTTTLTASIPTTSNYLVPPLNFDSGANAVYGLDQLALTMSLVLVVNICFE